MRIYKAGVRIVAALPAGSAELGQVRITDGTDVALVDSNGNLQVNVQVAPPATSGGYSRFYDNDLDETAVVVKSGAGQVYAISAFNSTNAPLFLQLFNVAQGSVNVGTTTPTEQYIIPGNADSDGAGFTQTFPHGVEFTTAITAACTTNNEGNGAPGANACVIVIHYA